MWHPYEKWLIFSDMPNSRMHRRAPDGAIEVFREPSNKANGNTRQEGQAAYLRACDEPRDPARS